MKNSINKAINSMPEYIERLRTEVSTLKGEKTELLEALEGIQKSMEGFKGVVAWAQSEAAENAFYNARAAIKKAKRE